MSDGNYERFLRGIAIVKNEYANKIEEGEKWADSELGWMLGGFPSRSKGAAVEKIIENYMRLKGYNIISSPDSEADRVVYGQRLEIKFSSLWEGGFYRFQQIRDQNIFIGVCGCLNG